MVKVPKCWISVRESLAQDNGQVGLEAAINEFVTDHPSRSKASKMDGN